MMHASLFQAPWWLDAVAPGSWAEITSGDPKGGPFGRITFQRHRRFGMEILRNPPLTQTAGPALLLTAEKHESRLAQIRDLVDELASRLPVATLTRLVLAPGFNDYLPFRWGGFSVSLACTYRLETLSDPERVWGGFSESCRRAIRKAEKRLVIRDDLDLDAALDVAGLSFKRQGLAVPYDRAIVHRAISAARAHAGAIVLAAQDAGGRLHAAMIVVHDSACAYYLLGGADPDLRDSGAQSLLMWEAIRRTSASSAVFDFEGSSTPGIERFFRGFGPERRPLVMISRAPRWLARAAAFGVVPSGLAGAL